MNRYGVFELPLALERSHVSYAHTDADSDRLIEGTHRAVAGVLADGGSMMTGASSTMGGVTA